MTTELKPCPFCGSSKIILDDQEFPQHAICVHCHCYGPEGDNLKETVEKWNAALRKNEDKRLSVNLPDGTYLEIGDCFCVEGNYPFCTDEGENYNAELSWDDECKTMFYDLYPVSDRVAGRSCGGSIEDLLPYKSRIARRPKRKAPNE